MNGLETFFTNPSDKQRVSGLTRRDIDIAESAALQRSIHDFMLVASDNPEHTAGGHRFNHKCVSALGGRGTLLSVYMQQNSQPSLSLEHSHVVLMAGLENPIVEAWSTTALPQAYGERTTELVIGEWEDGVPAADGMPLDQEDFKNRLADARDWDELPRVRFGGGVWEMEKDNHFEKFRELSWVENRVRLAIYRGFGKAVCKRFDPDAYASINVPPVNEQVDDPGQNVQKMVA